MHFTVWLNGMNNVVTYLHLLTLVEEHMLFISILYPIVSWAILYSSLQLLFIRLISAYNFRRILFFDLPLFHLPSRFASWCNLIIFSVCVLFASSIFSQFPPQLEIAFFSPTVSCCWRYLVNGHLVSYVDSCL